MTFFHFDKDKKFIGTSTDNNVSFGESPETNILVEEDLEFDIGKALKEEGDLSQLRIERNKLLDESDWVVTREREEEGSVSNYADWKTYRQSLRDITNTYKSIENVVWPTKPE